MKTLLGAISHRLAVFAVVLAVALTATTYVALSQETGPGDDPATEPIPPLSDFLPPRPEPPPSAPPAALPPESLPSADAAPIPKDDSALPFSEPLR